MAPQVRTASGTLALQKQCARKGFRASCISQHTGPVAAGPQGSAGLPQPFMKRHDQVAGFILAGGVSSRMGRDKALLEISGVPLLVRTARLIEPLVAAVTVIGSPERYASLGLRVIPDAVAGVGPLGGIATALRFSASAWNLILGCDLPYLTAKWLDWLIARALDSQADALLPETPRGVEPLCAKYRTSSAPAIAAAIAPGARKETERLACLAVQHAGDEECQGID